MKKKILALPAIVLSMSLASVNSAHANQCYTSDRNLKTSERKFKSECRGFRKVDCDQIENLWVCASRNLTNRDSLNSTIRQNNSSSQNSSSNTRTERSTRRSSPPPVVRQPEESRNTNFSSNNRECKAESRTLRGAMANFDRQCAGLVRADCDRMNNRWVCSTGMMGQSVSRNFSGDRSLFSSPRSNPVRQPVRVPRFDDEPRTAPSAQPDPAPRFTSSPSSNSSLYSKRGSDASWSVVRNAMDKGRNSTRGYTGQISIIDVNNGAVERGLGANPIQNALSLHTVGHSTLRRSAFNNFRRWYQEDGRTQVFRLFPGEENVRNSRSGAARVEAFTSYRPGQSRTWTGRYTIVNPAGCTTGGNCAIFQLKSSNQAENWAFQMNLDSRGNVTIKDNRGNRKNLLSNMIGRSFDMRVIDRSTNQYEVQIDGRTVFTGSANRTRGNSQFRWGMYMGRVVPRNDIMLFVSGAQIR